MQVKVLLSSVRRKLNPLHLKTNRQPMHTPTPIVRAFVFSLLLLSACAGKKDEPHVLLISFDGFRHDYVEKFNPPHFRAFIEGGTAAEHMLSSFPSKTFPNHYTVVTGMYPGNHGLVDNTFIDSTRNVTYTMGDRSLVQDEYYYGGTPLWQLAKQQGMRAGSFFWVGSEAPVAGSYPDFYKIYDGKVPNEARIDTVMHWFSLPAAERPRLVTLYFSLVDSEGHNSGPHSAEIRETVLEADRLLGLILRQRERLGLALNIIVTSDHGMYELTNEPDPHIYLGQLFEGDTTLKLANSGAIVHLYEDNSAERESRFRLLKQKQEGFKVYRKEETPERWHYRSHPRIGDLVLVAEPGHYFRNKLPDTTQSPMKHPWGVHGYDPYATPEMGAIFYANGPNIQAGLKIPAFENVHVYSLVAGVLRLKTPENIDGRREVLEKVYKE